LELRKWAMMPHPSDCWWARTAGSVRTEKFAALLTHQGSFQPMESRHSYRRHPTPPTRRASHLAAPRKSQNACGVGPIAGEGVAAQGHQAAAQPEAQRTWRDPGEAARSWQSGPGPRARSQAAERRWARGERGTAPRQSLWGSGWWGRRDQRACRPAKKEARTNILAASRRPRGGGSGPATGTEARFPATPAGHCPGASRRCVLAAPFPETEGGGFPASPGCRRTRPRRGAAPREASSQSPRRQRCHAWGRRGSSRGGTTWADLQEPRGQGNEPRQRGTRTE